MEKKYYLQNSSEKQGPFSLDELRYKYLKRSDLIWFSGLENWIEAQNLPELSVLFPQDSSKIPTINLSDPKELLRQPMQYSGRKIQYLPNNTIQLHTGNEIINYRFANFGERFIARLLDVLIIIIPTMCLPLIGNWLYFALQQSGDNQQTIGQKALNIKILSEDGEKVTFGQATGRFFANILNLLTLYFGYLMFFFTKRNQCLHDVLSSTIVVKELNRQKLIN